MQDPKELCKIRYYHGANCAAGGRVVPGWFSVIWSFCLEIRPLRASLKASACSYRSNRKELSLYLPLSHLPVRTNMVSFNKMFTPTFLAIVYASVSTAFTNSHTNRKRIVGRGLEVDTFHPESIFQV